MDRISALLRKAPRYLKVSIVRFVQTFRGLKKNSEIPPVKAGLLAGEFTLAIKRHGDL